MHLYLRPLLLKLGLQEKSRFSLDETAEIIGIRRDQVLDLLKRDKLVGVRASERRWGGIVAADLDDYLGRVQAAWEQRKEASRTKVGASVVPVLAPMPTPRAPPPSPIVTAPALPVPLPASIPSAPPSSNVVDFQSTETLSVTPTKKPVLGF